MSRTLIFNNMEIQNFVCNMFGENTYIVIDSDTKDCIIIDPGMMTPAEVSAVDNFIEEKKLKVNKILLTHLHIDHAMGVNHLKEKYGVEVYANEKDAILGARIAEQIQLFHLPITLGKVTIDQYLNEKDAITFGGLQLTAISTPGHSPGSLSYYNSDKKIVFTGDALFKQSIGRTDLPSGDYATLINSITEKILTLPDSTIICPGHGPTTTVKDEKKFNPYV